MTVSTPLSHKTTRQRIFYHAATIAFAPPDVIPPHLRIARALFICTERTCPRTSVSIPSTPDLEPSLLFDLQGCSATGRLSAVPQSADLLQSPKTRAFPATESFLALIRFKHLSLSSTTLGAQNFRSGCWCFFVRNSFLSCSIKNGVLCVCKAHCPVPVARRRYDTRCLRHEA